MRWSSLIKSKSEGDTEQNKTVLEYQPREFTLGTPEAALEYLERKKQGSDFVLSDVLRHTTGVEEIEKQSEESRIEQKVLERVAMIQKQAYDEGYALGKDEGYKAALEKKTNEINRGLLDLSDVMQSVQNLKPELISNNESHIMHLIYQIAEKIAYDHIEQKPEVILEVIRRAIHTAQAEEEVTVMVAPEQVAFLEQYKNSDNEKYEFLENIRLQPSDQILPGGCIIETNYGAIDARIGERFKKIWAELSAAIPKVKDVVSSDDSGTNGDGAGDET
jgi:flagellar assembly protein FliH